MAKTVESPKVSAAGAKDAAIKADTAWLARSAKDMPDARIRDGMISHSISQQQTPGPKA